MKSLIDILKPIAQKVGLIANYVIERGTNGIWHYEKWNNGKYNCECASTLSSTPGGINAINIPVPSDMIEVTYYNATLAGNGFSGEAYHTWCSGVNGNLIISASGSGNSWIVAAEIRGKWK